MVQNQRGYNSNSRSVQKKKNFSKKTFRLRKLIHLEMLVVGLLIAFFIGKRVGQVTAKEEILAAVQASVRNQEYGAGNEKLLELLTGEAKEKEESGDLAEKMSRRLKLTIGIKKIQTIRRGTIRMPERTLKKTERLKKIVCG